MRVWHGTGKHFDRFDLSFVGTGEGVAKRGFGINFTLDREVAEYFAQCAAGNASYVYEAEVPDLKLMLPLEESVGTMRHLVLALHQTLGHDLDAVFEAAAMDDLVSMSFPDRLARQWFDKAMVSPHLVEPWDNLSEWSPGVDWGAVCERCEGLGFGYNEDFDTLEHLYRHAACELGSPRAASKWLLTQHIPGTYSREAMSSAPGEQGMSVVVFDPADVDIVDVSAVRRRAIG